MAGARRRRRRAPIRVTADPPASTSSIAVTPAEKAVLPMIPARQRPNDPAITNIAVGNDATTIRTHDRSLSPEVSCVLPEPAIEYASARLSV